MKVKFTKLAALLLAGVALFATGCTDYEVDIQRVDKKVDDLASGRVATLENQLSALQLTLERDYEKIADHNADIEALNGQIATLKGQIKELQDADIATAREIERINGEIGKLETRIKAAEDAIKNLNEVVIPAINEQIDNLNALTAGDWGDKTIKEYIDVVKTTLDLLLEGYPTDDEGNVKALVDVLDDYVLSSVFEEFVAIVGTKQELEEMEGTIIGRMKALEALTAGDWEDQTIQQFIKAEDQKLQNQLDAITNEEGTGRLDVLEKTAEYYFGKVDEILDELAFAEGDLQGYIDNGDAETLRQAKEYTDTEINKIKNYLKDICDIISGLQKRIQSIVFVPEYDDLKITTQMAYVSQQVEEGDELVEMVAAMDQRTTISYKILPAQYASAAAADFENLFNFDVKEVLTRIDRDADEEDEEFAPSFEILGVSYDPETVDETGILTFTVMPVNVASADFAANGLTPQYDVELRAGEDSVPGVIDGAHVWATDGETRGYVGYYRRDDYLPYAWSIPVWNIEDLENYQFRTAFAASLRLKNEEDINAADYWAGTEEFTTEYNEVASTYNALFPEVTEINILPDPYKPVTNEQTGEIEFVPAVPEYQYLPYTALRPANADDEVIGELDDQDPKGYRVILDGAIPAAEINGEIISLDSLAKLGYVLPAVSTNFDEFTYDQGTAEEEVDEDLFIETAQVYAEIEMNGAHNAAARKQAVGNIITGNYFFESFLGTTPFFGEVEITRPLAALTAATTITWTYQVDAGVDHASFVGDDFVYAHEGESIALEGLEDLASKYGIEIGDFEEEGVTCDIVVKDAEGNDVSEDVLIENLEVDEDNDQFIADFSGFDWGTTYTYEITFHLDAADVIVTGTLTTVDRKRDTIIIDLGQHAFILNGEEYDRDEDVYETAEPVEFREDLYNAFITNGIITAADFEDADAFVPADGDEQEAHLEAVAEEDINVETELGEDEALADLDDQMTFGDVFASFAATSEELHDIFTAGKKQVFFVTTYIGQKVKVVWDITVDLPEYNFLHLRFYAWNVDEEVTDFVTKRDFADNDGSVKWWTQVNPSYFYAENANESNRFALHHYDVANIDLAQLAFNVVDEEDAIINPERFEEEYLRAYFDYTDENLGETALPAVNAINNLSIYNDLWMDNTTFYYGTCEKKFIPVRGHLGVMSGETFFEIPTRFTTPKNSVEYPDVALDYSTYALVRWTPFKEPVAEDVTIVLDENKEYRVSLYSGMGLKDNRPNGVSYDVIVDGEWVEGNIRSSAAAGATAETGNGFVSGVNAKEAYGIRDYFDYANVQLPDELATLLNFQYYSPRSRQWHSSNPEGRYIPYIVYDYKAELQFYGTVVIPVKVILRTPWQEPINFEYNIIIKGVDDPSTDNNGEGEGNGEDNNPGAGEEGRD